MKGRGVRLVVVSLTSETHQDASIRWYCVKLSVVGSGRASPFKSCNQFMITARLFHTKMYVFFKRSLTLEINPLFRLCTLSAFYDSQIKIKTFHVIQLMVNCHLGSKFPLISP